MAADTRTQEALLSLSRQAAKMEHMPIVWGRFLAKALFQPSGDLQVKVSLCKNVKEVGQGGVRPARPTSFLQSALNSESGERDGSEPRSLPPPPTKRKEMQAALCTPRPRPLQWKDATVMGPALPL